MTGASRGERDRPYGHRDQNGTNSQAILSEVLTPSEAAALLKVKTSWLYEAARTRRLPYLKLGRHLRFLRSDLEAWLVEQRVAARR
jgi:excisionase family DNA binding protein